MNTKSNKKGVTMAQKKSETELAIVEKQDLAVINQDIVYDSGNHSGFENIKPEDIAIPFIKILQALSPQVRGTTKLPGANEGDFCNSVTEAIYKDSITVVPCFFQKVFVEWVIRENGGGFVKQHLSSDILNSTKKDTKNRDILPNGNSIVTTAYHYCLLVKEDGTYERVVLALTSTNLKKSRRWLSQMVSLMLTINGKKVNPPMYSHMYTVTSQEESNDQGSWYTYNFGNPVIISSKDLYLEAKKFYMDISAGTIKMAEPPEHEENGKVPVSTTDVADKF